MGSRRGRGEGTYEKRGEGVYRLRVYVGKDPITGRPRQASRTVHVRGDTEARRELRRFIAEAEQGQVARVGGQASVESLLVAWLDNLERAGRSRSTLDSYRIITRTHLIPSALGKMPVSKVDGFVLDEYYAQKLREGLKPRTVRLHHSVVSSAFTQAMKWGWVNRNPASQATPPVKPPDNPMAPEAEQVRKLLEAAAGDPDLSMAIVLAALTGARRGELCGLQWADVDWERATLRIERARVPTEGGDHTTTTKRKTTRTVALGPLGLAALERYRQVQEARARDLATEPTWEWLLSYDCGRSPLRAKALGEAITALGKAAGVPVTTHAFRRFAATQLVGAGVDVRTAAGRLGHTPDMLLRVYAAFMPSRDVEAARGLEMLVLPALPLPEEGL